MPNPSKPEQQINIMQHNVHFQPQLRNRERQVTPDEITRCVEVRMKQLTSAVLRESATFFAPGEQERDIVKVFDVKSFDFHDPEKLSQQYIYELISVAGHFNDGNFSFPERGFAICTAVHVVRSSVPIAKSSFERYNRGNF